MARFYPALEEKHRAFIAAQRMFFTATGTATSRAYVSDLHLGRGSRRELTFSTLGDSHDRWEHDGERWRIRHRTKLNRGVIGSMDVFLGG